MIDAHLIEWNGAWIQSDSVCVRVCVFAEENHNREREHVTSNRIHNNKFNIIYR